jgi:hypothetical protein
MSAPATGQWNQYSNGAAKWWEWDNYSATDDNGQLIQEDDPRWDCRTMGNRVCGTQPTATIPSDKVLIVAPVDKPRAVPAPVKPKPKAASAPAAKPSGCDWMSEYSRTKAQYPASWTIGDRGAWGTTSTGDGGVFIAARTPCRYVRSVMLHEYVHVRQHAVYGRGMAAALAGYGGMEKVADCGAKMLGATWTNYTQTCTAKMNAAAAAVLKGH